MEGLKMVDKKVVVKEKISYWLTILKAGTYMIAGAVADGVFQAFTSGLNIKEALIVGCGVGLIAGIKNIFKHQWNIDLDLVKLVK